MKLRETFDTGEGMTPGYVVILTHDSTYLCREKSGLRRFIVFIKGESHYFNDPFKAVYAFREEIQ